jgi:hypothetical protein
MPDTDWMDRPVDEVKTPLNPSQMARLLAQSELMRDNSYILLTAFTIKEALENGNPHDAAEAWNELEEEQQQILWMAPTYGGLFTTEERKQIRKGT